MLGSTLSLTKEHFEMVKKPSKTPGYETFKEDIMAIFPDGDLKKGYERMCNHISLFKNENGLPLDYPFILDKFKACHAQWKFRYGAGEAKGFLSREAALDRYTFDDFIDKEIYQREFVIDTGSSDRSKYLFGGFSISYLKHQLDLFLKTFKHGNS